MPHQTEEEALGVWRQAKELLFLASIGDVERMQALVEKHRASVFHPFCCDSDGRTPLHLAATEGHLDAVQWLLNEGCNPSSVDRFSRTPLECALLAGHADVQRTLIAHGAKVYRLVDHTQGQRRKKKLLFDPGCRGSGTQSAEEGGEHGTPPTSLSRKLTRLASEELTGSGDNIHVSSGRASGSSGSGSSMWSAQTAHSHHKYNATALRQHLRGFNLGHQQEPRHPIPGLELGKLIGRGSFGKVYKGIWQGRTVAVKVLNHEGRKVNQVNALHESLVSAHMQHPNVVTTMKVHTLQRPRSPPTPTSEEEERERNLRAQSQKGPGTASPSSSREPSLQLTKGSSIIAPSRNSSLMSAATSDGRGTSIGTNPMRATLRSCDSFGSQAPQNRREALLLNLSRIPFIPPSSPFEGSIHSGPPTRHLTPTGHSTPTGDQLSRRKSGGFCDFHPARKLPSGPANTWDAGGPDVSMGMSLKMGISDSVGASVSMGTDVSAKSGVAADGASAGATYQEHFRITEGDVAVETFLIMEYADQGSLDKRIAQGALKGQLVPILLCALDVAAGMHYLHLIGVLHSDLKAGNVLLRSAPVTPHDPRGYTCKIADFGMSRLLMDDASHVSTNTHGTVAYVGPEVLQRGAIAMPADVYSFAMLLMELWTGDVMYKGVNYHQVLYTVFSGQKPKIPDDMPAELKVLMEQCWSTEPCRRPTFKDVAERIRLMLAAVRGTDVATAAAAPQPST